MTFKNELQLLLTGRALSVKGYAVIFGCGVVIGALFAWVVWS